MTEGGYRRRAGTIELPPPDDPNLEEIVDIAHKLFRAPSREYSPWHRFAPFQVAIFEAVVRCMLDKSNAPHYTCINAVCRMVVENLIYPTHFVEHPEALLDWYLNLTRSMCEKNGILNSLEDANAVMRGIYETAKATTGRVFRDYVQKGMRNLNWYTYRKPMLGQPEEALKWPLPYEPIWWTELATRDIGDVSYLMRFMGGAISCSGFIWASRSATPLTPTMPVYGTPTPDAQAAELHRVLSLPDSPMECDDGDSSDGEIEGSAE